MLASFLEEYDSNRPAERCGGGENLTYLRIIRQLERLGHYVPSDMTVHCPLSIVYCHSCGTSVVLRRVH